MQYCIKQLMQYIKHVKAQLYIVTIEKSCTAYLALILILYITN